MKPFQKYPPAKCLQGFKGTRISYGNEGEWRGTALEAKKAATTESVYFWELKDSLSTQAIAIAQRFYIRIHQILYGELPSDWNRSSS